MHIIWQSIFQIETQTSERSILQTDKIEAKTPYYHGFASPLYEIAPSSTNPYGTLHLLSAQQNTQSPNLVWCQYSAPEAEEDANRTEFYSINNDDQVLDKRPPVLDDFEKTWDNVLNNHNSPDWAAVQPQQWRTWFEFYKANSKVQQYSFPYLFLTVKTQLLCIQL